LNNKKISLRKSLDLTNKIESSESTGLKFEDLQINPVSNLSNEGNSDNEDSN